MGELLAGFCYGVAGAGDGDGVCGFCEPCGGKRVAGVEVHASEMHHADEVVVVVEDYAAAVGGVYLVDVFFHLGGRG